MQSNWTEATTTAADYILNKPNLAPVATAGTYASLTGQPTGTYSSLTGRPTQLWQDVSQFTKNLTTFSALNTTGNSALASTTVVVTSLNNSGILSVTGTSNLNATTISSLTLTGPVTGTPVNGVYNSGTAVTNTKIWYGKGTTTTAVCQTTNGAACPATSINSATTTANTINCVPASSGNVVANGTLIYKTVTGY